MASFKNLVSTTSAQISSGGTITGDLVINGDLQVDGGGSLSFDEIVSGTQVVEITNTEAFLVRKASDGGDVFIVDTTNSNVKIPNGILTLGTADSTSGHINAFENMSFNIDTDNDDTNRFFEFSINGSSGSGTELMRLAESGVLSLKSGRLRLSDNETDNTNKESHIISSQYDTDESEGYMAMRIASNSADNHVSIGGGHADVNASTLIRFFTASNKTTRTGTERMRIGSSGNISIGTTSSYGLLTVSGGTPALYLEESDADAGDKLWNIAVAGETFAMNCRNDANSSGNSFFAVERTDSSIDSIKLKTGAGTDALVIDSSQNVGIGTSSPSVPLHISKATDGGLTEIFINNAASGGSTDETVGIRFTHNQATAGGILAGRTEDFSNSANRSGHLIFKTNHNDSYAERMRIDSAGRLGLGISDPDAYLSGARNLVLGGTSGDHGLTIRTASDSKGIIAFGDGDASSDAGYRGQIQYLHSSDKMLFMTSTTNRMAIDSSGVGIGTSSPVGTLTINSDTAEDGVIITTTNTDAGGSADQGLGLDWRFTSVSSYPWAYVRAIFQGSGDTELAFGTKPASAGDNVAERMRIDNQGRVGIGTASPSQLLHIQGTAGLSLLESTGSGQNAEFQFKTTARIFGIGQNIGTTGKFEIYDRTAGITRLAIDSSGNVGIGTSSPAELLEIEGTSTAFIQIQATSADSSSGISIQNDAINYVLRTNGGNSDSFEIRDATNNAQRLILDTNSRISLGNNDSSGATSNTIFGRLAGNAIASGAIDNVLIGNEAGNDVTTGDYLVAIGSFALEKEDVGRSSVAIGASALGRQNTASEGSANTIGIGTNAGFYNVTGTDNVLIGHNAGVGADGNSHSNNVAVGSKAMYDITTGGNNVGVGSNALENILAGNNNVAIGVDSGKAITGTSSAVLIGKQAGEDINNATALGTVAVGHQSLKALTSGSGNTAVGYLSLQSVDDGSKCTAVGYQAGNTTEGATKSTFIGYDTEGSGANVNNETVIGSDAVGQGGNSVTLGNADVTKLYVAPDCGTSATQSIVFKDTGGEQGQVVYDHGNGQFQFYVEGAIKARIESGGAIYLDGGGIKFPATQVAHADANTLDDYEEGTWTAGVSFDGTGASGSLSTSFDTGTYTKIGRVVHVQGFFALASVSSPSGNLFITGLPFTSASGSEGTEFPAVSIRMTDVSSAIIGAPQGFVNSGSTQIQIERFRQDTTNGGSDRQIGAFIGATTTILISGTYFV